ncbi:uncharacterized protein LOC141586837 isoform X2 [Silene latifolia]|uniref:uncharacterized protein LOC141586837 isoform X2 n=1 Tax=Silene latifolia TaxID=37657 RepID=UPI003D7743C4
MGGLLHLFDFHYGHRKHKKQEDVGVDAPRNSLELTAGTWQDQGTVKDGEQDLPKVSYFSTEASMKKLICDELSKQSNNKQNAPSIVARLMGMDVLPVDTKPEVQPLQDKDVKIDIITDKKVQHIEKVSAIHSLPKSKSTIKKEQRSYRDAYARYWNYAKNSGKPRPRVHPQEKELQKFKKEFEAWQAARFLECARVVELGNIPEQWLAQLDLTKEKMSLYESSRKTVVEKTLKPKKSKIRSRSLRSVDSDDLGFKKDSLPSEHKESYSFSRISSGRDFEQICFEDSDMNSEKISAPTKIVILKPGPDSFSTANDESWVTSTSSMGDRDCIEDLLEEVKERLRYEMQSKTSRNGSMVRGRGIETPFKEKPAFTKPNYQLVRETASRDFGRKLRRSESARLYRGEFQVNEELAPSSPESMTKDARKFLSDRLRNAVDGESHGKFSNLSNGFPSDPFFDDARSRLEQARDILNAESGRNYWRDLNYEDTKPRSFRRELRDDWISQEQPSPRSLVRSLSAPVSGMSFGKLLLEDRHISSGAHIKRKHEALANFSVEGQRKERFNFREKIKSRLSLRKKLFSRKLQSIDSESNEYDSEKDTSVAGFGDRNENLTEVPPSPASVCSSVHEDFWKPTENPSPISMSDVTSVGDHSVGNVFREISSNLTELRKQLNQLDYEGSEITTVTEDPSELEAVVDIEDEAEAYVKNLLVTSGFYDGSWVKSFSRWDPFVKPIGNWVFEKVEESYRKPTDTDESIDYDETSLEHKLLFDLLNESLTVLLGPPRILSKFRRKITEITMVPPPQGRKLLNQVWEMICECLNPCTDPACYSLDDLVADDLNNMPWSNLIDEEMSAVGKEVEYLITEELVDELVIDMEF